MMKLAVGNVAWLVAAGLYWVPGTHPFVGQLCVLACAGCLLTLAGLSEWGRLP